MQKNTKKLNSFLFRCLGAVLTLAVFAGRGFAEEVLPEGGKKQSFLVSAYYSPLPNQSRYLRGNYEAEIRLNGRGTNGADGTEVYPGMLAAPKAYGFGTKIYLPGLGVGVVHDRGGAIVTSAGYDRIDVWMGQGEEALARALQWGMRRVEGVVYQKSAEVQESLNFDDLPAQQSVLTQVKGIFTKTLAPGSKGDDVKILQQHMTDLGFFDGPQTGNYGKMTEEAVFKFQKSVRLVSSFSDLGAGVFGPKTQDSLKNILAKDPSKNSEIAAKPLRTFSFFPSRIERNKKGPEVKRLQIILKNLGYFTAEFSENYGEKTAAAVLAFQKDHQLALNEQSPGAGTFGPKTQSALVDALEQTTSEKKEFTPKEALFVLAPSDDVPGKLASDTPKKILVRIEQLAYGDSGEAVRLLQQNLIARGMLEAGADTGFYGEKTKSAVFQFQKDHDLAVNSTDSWAGTFGLKTEAVLLQNLEIS